ncbi:hypothetical protein DZS_12870 [Dickeya ananatis]
MAKRKVLSFLGLVVVVKKHSVAPSGLTWHIFMVFKEIVNYHPKYGENFEIKQTESEGCMFIVMAFVFYRMVIPMWIF